MSKSSNKGFTLVELIVVIVILAILIGVTIGGIYMYVGKSRVLTDIGNASSMSGALSSLAVDSDVYSYAVSNDSNVIITWKDIVPNDELTADNLQVDNSIASYIQKVLTNGLPASQTRDGFSLQIKTVKGTNPDIYVNCIANASGGITDSTATEVTLN